MFAELYMVLFKKPFVYIAGPYTKGIPSINALYHCGIYRKMIFDDKVIPYAPLLSHYLVGQEEVPYGRWLELQIEVMERCDAVLSIDVDFDFMGRHYEMRDSQGRDAEVSRSRDLGIPVFCDLEKLYEWARYKYGNRMA
jgi:hypothetical protein